MIHAEIDPKGSCLTRAIPLCPHAWSLEVAVLTTAVHSADVTIMADSQEECWSRLCYAIEEHLPLVVLTGAAEVGKSTLLQQLARTQRPRSQHAWFHRDATGLTAEEFSRLLSRAVEAPDVQPAWDGLADWFDGLAATRGTSVWLIDHVDQAAENLSLLVRRFLRIVESSHAQATVILVARQMKDVSALADCVNLWCHLPAWDLASTTKSLQSGSTAWKPAFPYTSDAIQAVQDCTGGVAGQVHRLSELCQLAASVREDHQIDVDLVLEVWNELVAPQDMLSGSRAH